jgi:hypothetical protein
MSVMRIVFTLLLAVALWVFATMLARAEVRILASPGGQVGPFLDLFEKVRNSGERVVIDGPCLSACTLVLSMIPSERICVTRRAVFGFHAARSMDRRGRLYAEPAASRLVLQAYPDPVKDWIIHRGGLTSRLLLLRGRELTAMYRACR